MAEIKYQEPNTTSKMFKACAQIWDAMYESSEPMIADKDMPARWEGKLTYLFEDVGVGQSYYGKITRILQDMGCMEKEARGSHYAKASWILVKEPVEREYSLLLRKQRADKRNGKQEDANDKITEIKARLNELFGRMVTVEEKVQTESKEELLERIESVEIQVEKIRDELI